MNILFVCSRNKKRSLTAETIFRNHGQHIVSSAGTEESAKRRFTADMLERADIIFVMEKRHREKITERFGQLQPGKQLIILNIPDEYEYMDDELVEMLQDMVRPYL